MNLLLNTKVRNTLLLSLLIFLLIFTRFYNLDLTARFIWDESSDLVKIHQYFVEKKITLVGPITESGDRVYSSLTYYMLMPFAYLGFFDPVSPVWGTAFFGIFSALILIKIIKLINPAYSKFIFLFVLVFFPLVETSRWAWNPNLIPFWTTLGIFMFLQGGKLSYLLSGIFLGLNIHHHYLSIFALFGFSIANFYIALSQKKFEKFILFLCGILLTITPFLIFDLRHPPGLFLTRALFFNPVKTNLNFVQALQNAKVWYEYMIFYYAQIKILAFFTGIIIPILLILDLKNREKNLIFALPIISQISGLIFIYNPGPIYYYYLLPSTIFFIIWLFYPRSSTFTKSISKLIILILITGGVLSIIPKLTKASWQTDIKSVRAISQIIALEIKNNDLKNCNLAVLASPDNNTYGRRYRDLLLIQNISLKTKDEYQFSDHLFVISTSEEKIIRNDPAYEMNLFRKGPLRHKWQITKSPWVVYHFTR